MKLLIILFLLLTGINGEVALKVALPLNRSGLLANTALIINIIVTFVVMLLTFVEMLA